MCQVIRRAVLVALAASCACSGQPERSPYPYQPPTYGGAAGSTGGAGASGASGWQPSVDDCPPIGPTDPAIELFVPYGEYLVTNVSKGPSGTYSFFSKGGQGLTSATLCRDGSPVSAVAYPWQETIGVGHEHTFSFPGGVDITLASVAGTLNLYGIDTSVFDGHHTWVVP